jgi:hypothetical protein
VTRFDNTTGVEKTIRIEKNYAIMDFSERRRVDSGYGWKKFHGVMQPGQCYSITIDSYDNVYRFKKTADGAFNTQAYEELDYTETDVTYRGWNGLGNGTMSHIDLSAEGIEKVQIYDHASNSYMPVGIEEYTFVVGSSYFVQAPASHSVINYSASPESSNYLRAPQRAAAHSEFGLTLVPEGSTVATDRLYVGCSEEATDRYEIGRDLTKFGNPTEAKVAQVWTNAYGLKLCDIEMPIVNMSARCELNLYAPQAGSYQFNVESAPEDAVLYLTHNGKIIWNLSMSSYTFDLSQGTTEGYGLRLVANAPQVATGLEEDGWMDNENGMRKIFIDNQVYIVTPEGAMYDMTGKYIK